jgi:hypothetical protein
MQEIQPDARAEEIARRKALLKAAGAKESGVETRLAALTVGLTAIEVEQFKAQANACVNLAAAQLSED